MDTTIFRAAGFEEVVACDFEFYGPRGERPVPLVEGAHELMSGQQHHLFGDELLARREAPYPTGPRVLFVAHFASAELSCFLALGRKLPVHILDTYVEFRNQTNGLYLPEGPGLLGALSYFGFSVREQDQKQRMRRLAMRGGPYTPQEWQALVKYNDEDVIDTITSLEALLPKLDLTRGILHGRSMIATAYMERTGLPIDRLGLDTIYQNWSKSRGDLIFRVDARYGLCNHWTRKFVDKRFQRWLDLNEIPWLYLPSGKPRMDKDTFADMAKLYPEVAPIRDLRNALSKLNLGNLAIGSDGRNRALLGPFGTITGRYQPSTTAYVLMLAKLFRSMVRIETGYSLANLDFEQQEFGIAGALSQDERMMEAYKLDPYIGFGIQAGLLPTYATALLSKTRGVGIDGC